MNWWWNIIFEENVPVTLLKVIIIIHYGSKNLYLVSCALRRLRNIKMKITVCNMYVHIHVLLIIVFVTLLMYLWLISIQMIYKQIQCLH